MAPTTVLSLSSACGGQCPTTRGLRTLSEGTLELAAGMEQAIVTLVSSPDLSLGWTPVFSGAVALVFSLGFLWPHPELAIPLCSSTMALDDCPLLQSGSNLPAPLLLFLGP